MRSFLQLQKLDRTLLGTFCALGSVDAVELACHAGFDFVILDAQHGTFDGHGMREAIRAVDAAGGYPIVRIPAHGLATVEGFLDAGCPALLAPMVNTPEQAAELVAAAYYPPLGQRSQSGCRASLRGTPDYRQTFNRDFSLIVQIEHISAVNQIDAILAVPGVTACFIGPSDLASSLESTPDQALAVAVERVRSACEAAHKPVGIAVGDVEHAQRHVDNGYRFITLATDRRFLASAFDQAITAWRAPLKR